MKNNAKNRQHIEKRFPEFFSYKSITDEIDIIDNFYISPIRNFSPPFPHATKRWWEARHLVTATRTQRLWLISGLSGHWHCPYQRERLIQLINRRARPERFCQTLIALVLTDIKHHITLNEPISYNVTIYPLNLKGLPNG